MDDKNVSEMNYVFISTLYNMNKTNLNAIQWVEARNKYTIIPFCMCLLIIANLLLQVLAAAVKYHQERPRCTSTGIYSPPHTKDITRVSIRVHKARNWLVPLIAVTLESVWTTPSSLIKWERYCHKVGIPGTRHTSNLFCEFSENRITVERRRVDTTHCSQAEDRGKPLASEDISITCKKKPPSQTTVDYQCAAIKCRSKTSILD